MQHHDIEELMALDWHTNIRKNPEGGFVLTVRGLDDFAVFGNLKREVQTQFHEALRSHLNGYLAVGKVVPVAGRIVEQSHGHTGGMKMWERIGFNAATGEARSEPATT